MDIQNRIKNIEPYFKGLEYISNYILVKVFYKTNWNVLPSNNENVKISQDDNDKNLYYYYTDKSNDCNIIFDLIDKTVKFNMESEDKVNLLKEKVEELRKLFLEYDISTLKKLKFSFDTKRKYTKKSKDILLDNNEENSENNKNE